MSLRQQDLSMMNILGYAGAGLVGLGCLEIIKRYVKWFFSPLQKLPGPNAGFLTGAYRQIMIEPFLAPHKRWIAAAGPDANMVHYTSVFGRSSILILDKDIIRQILTANAGKKDPRFYKDLKFLENVIGRGLVVLEGEDWMRHRKLLQPAFHPQTIKAALDETVPTKVQELMDYWSIAADQKREIDAQSHFSALTLDIIGPTAFSHECDGLAGVKRWTEQADAEVAEIDDPFLKSLNSAFNFDLVSTFCFLLGLSGIDGMRKPKRVARNMLNSEVDKIITNAAKEKKSTKSVLSLLLETEEGLTTKELRDEVKVFVLAGHETTSTWCVWAMYCLAKHPEIQEKVFRDVVKVSPGDARIGVDEADQMEYLKAFMQEVLRLYPPAGFITRHNKYTETFDNVTIPAGTRLTLSPHLLHRSERYWDDPLTFQPERWINVSPEEAERRRFAFFPFSLGGRNCIGSRFATLEAQVIVASLVRAFRVRIAPSQVDVEHTFSTRITMKPKPGLLVAVEKRAKED